MASAPPPFFPPQPPMVSGKVHEADERLRQPRTSSYMRPSLTAATSRRQGSRPTQISRREWSLLAGVLLVAGFVRLRGISHPTSVVFDEVHFGGFASKYIRRTFFMDVHPPLAKLLITLAGWLGGYQGGPEDFKDIAKEYGPSVPYLAMRLLPGILGVLLVPITYLTLRALSCSVVTALLGSTLITFENALAAQSRLILLDSPLIFFTASTVLCFLRFTNEDARQPFTRLWWKWLVVSGFSLGAVASCKWVGLFTIATLGLATLGQLWVLLGDLRVTPRVWVRHFLARAVGLIVIPVLVYLTVFRIHFWILDGSGEGDGFMSSEFQHTLRGHGMPDTYADVALGSTISLRHVHTQGGYLHSHAHNYPTGSQQQQITLYPHRDTNNEWLVINITTPGLADLDHEYHDPMTFIADKAQIRLQHKTTQKRLHSHDVRPPISEVDFQNEVSGYGFDGFAGDANDIWIVELEQDKDRKSRKHLRAIRSHFRLRHYLTGCYLFSHRVKLPEWGFEQQEVTCNKNPTLENALWYVETNEHPMLNERSEKVNYKRPSFLSKFAELQVVMWNTNAGLTDRHAYDSRPTSWPFLRRGINFWVKNHRQIYLIGNPFIWWSSTVAVLLYLFVRGLLILRAKRGFRDLHHPTVAAYDPIFSFLTLAWFLHYAPFFLMSRQLFLHHYLPALYFSVLILAVTFDLACSRLKTRSRLVLAGVVALAAIATWRHFRPLTYGTPWTKGQCEASKWRSSWDFSCNDFLDDLALYEVRPEPMFTNPAETIVAPPGEDQAFATTELAAVPIEPGQNVFDSEANKAQVAGDAAGQPGNKDDLLPFHGDVEDRATGLAAPADAADHTAGDALRAAETSAAWEREAKKMVGFEELTGQERREAEALVREALVRDQEAVREELREEKERESVEAVV